MDTGTHSNEESYKCSKEKISKNEGQRRTKGGTQNDMLRSEIKIRSNNKGEKKSWKEYCNLTTAANSWNAVCRLVAGKQKTNTQLTTLQKPDGSLTKDTKETLSFMLEHFTPEDNELEDNTHHKQVRAITTQSQNTPDDSEFKERRFEE